MQAITVHGAKDIDYITGEKRNDQEYLQIIEEINKDYIKFEIPKELSK